MISLKSLAQDILNLESDQDVSTLKNRTGEIYNKLVILEYLSKTIDSLESDTEIVQFEETSDVKIVMKQEELVEEEVEEDFSPEGQEEIEPDEIETETEVLEEISTVIDNENNDLEDGLRDDNDDLEDLFEPTFDSIKEDFSLKDEFKDTISLDETEKLFETKRTETKPVSLNEKLVGRKIQVGLNDRIAFVNSLFNFNQSEFNRVLGELNAFETEIEAKNYIENNVKIKYNWSGKEDVEERFMLLVERKFM